MHCKVKKRQKNLCTYYVQMLLLGPVDKTWRYDYPAVKLNFLLPLLLLPQHIIISIWCALNVEMTISNCYWDLSAGSILVFLFYLSPGLFQTITLAWYTIIMWEKVFYTCLVSLSYTCKSVLYIDVHKYTYFSRRIYIMCYTVLD